MAHEQAEERASAPPPPSPQGEGEGEGGADEERLYATGEVMQRSGLSRQVLYQYTAMGLIKEAETNKTGHRLYPASVFGQLKLIRDLNESGYTLRDIREVFFSRRRGH